MGGEVGGGGRKERGEERGDGMRGGKEWRVRKGGGEGVEGVSAVPSKTS